MVNSYYILREQCGLTFSPDITLRDFSSWTRSVDKTSTDTIGSFTESGYVVCHCPRFIIQKSCLSKIHQAACCEDDARQITSLKWPGCSWMEKPLVYSCSACPHSCLLHLLSRGQSELQRYPQNKFQESPTGPIHRSSHLWLLCDWPTLALVSFPSSTPVAGLLFLSNPSSTPWALMHIFALWNYLVRSQYLPQTPKSQSDTRVILFLTFTIFQTQAFSFTSACLVICWFETIRWTDIFMYLYT